MYRRKFVGFVALRLVTLPTDQSNKCGIDEKGEKNLEKSGKRKK
jgi:hypothetical protein